MFRIFQKSMRVVVVVSVAALMATSVALAQQLGGQEVGSHEGTMQQQLSPEQLAFVQEYQQKQRELSRLQEQLAAVEQKVVESNPEIQQKRSALEDKVVEQMRVQGVNPDQMIEELRDIAGQLDQGLMTDDERMALIREFEQKRKAFLNAQQRALEDAEVQSMQQDLRDTVLTAMVEIEPATEELIQQMLIKEQELIQMQQRAMQMQ